MQNQKINLSLLLRQGIAASQAQMTEPAIDAFLAACKEQPDSCWPQFFLGAELAECGRLEEAEAAYIRATEIAPDFLLAYYELGVLQFFAGKISGAIKTWTPIQSLSDTSYLKLFATGYIELTENRVNSAIDLFKRGVIANQENPAISKNIKLLISGLEMYISGLSSPPQTKADESTDSHFLLSNYGRNLH